MKGLKAYVLDLGSGSSDAAWFKLNTTVATTFDENPTAVWITNIFTAILIEHPKEGFILYDTGVPVLNEIPERYLPIIKFQINEDQTLEKQLDKIGITPKDISHVILSHMHFDHTGRLSLFKDTATIYVNRKDAEYAYTTVLGTTDVTAHGFYHKPALLTEIQKLVYLDDEDVELFEGVHVLNFHGHTPGTLGLLLELESGNYLAASDGASLEANYNGIPSGITLDSISAARSIQKMKKVAKDHKVKEVWFSHDKAQFDQMKKIPEFY